MPSPVVGPGLSEIRPKIHNSKKSAGEVLRARWTPSQKGFAEVRIPELCPEGCAAVSQRGERACFENPSQRSGVCLPDACSQ